MTPLQLTDKLIEAGLLNSEQVRACCESAGLTLEDVAAETLAKRLVKDGCLTLFQAQMAINGKASSLIIGSYVVLEKLGQGGMGQVFKARHKTMKREVALKVISPNVVKDETSLRRFQREVEAAAQLNHPNIVTAHDAGEFKGTHYLVMEYIKGKDLSSLVKTSGPLNAGKAVALILQAANGLAYAHRNGIVHRDIKPANLLLDDSGTVKILDMGLARFDTAAQDHASVAGLTGTGMLMGTVDYMSPEQAMDSKTADARSDIYSLGCTLYYLLTGKAVYEEDTVVKRLMSHQSAALPQLPIPDQALQEIFERTIAKKPEQRYGSCEQLSNDWQQWLDSFRAEGIKETKEMPLGGGNDSFLPALRPEHTASGRATSGPDATGTRKQSRVLPAIDEKPSDTTPSSASMEQTVIPGKAASSGKVNTTRLTQTNPSTKTPAESAQRPFSAAETTSTPASRRATRTTLEPRRPNTEAKSLSRKPWLLYTGLGCGAVLLAFLAVTVFRVKTPIGTIVIETRQPEIAGAVISVDETQRVTLETGDGAEPIEILADEKEHTLKVTKGGFETFTQTFSVKAGDSQTITVRLDPLLIADVLQTSKPEPTSDLDRDLAAWVLSNGGQVQIDSGEALIARAEELPPLPFHLTAIHDNRSKYAFQDADIGRLAELKYLSTLVTASQAVSDAGIEALRGNKTLRKLLLPHVPLTGRSFEVFQTIPELRELITAGTHATKDDVKLLTVLTHLEVLGLSGSAVTDEDCAMFLQFGKLRSIDLSGSPVGDRAAEILSQMPELTTLYFGNTQFSDVGAQYLSKLPKLTSLWCDSSKLTDSGFATLASMSELKLLSVGNNSITDAGIVSLTSTSKLASLGLPGIPITDKSIPVLMPLTSLGSLSIEKTHLTEGGVRQLYKALPNCFILSDYPQFAAERLTAASSTSPSAPASDAAKSAPMSSGEAPSSVQSMSKDSVAGTLAPKDLRLSEGAADRPPFAFKLKPSDPLGEFAAVSRPGKIEGLLGWSIEPLVHRGGIRIQALGGKGVIATGGHDCVIRLWTPDWQLLKVLPGHLNAVCGLAFSPDGTQLASVAPAPHEFVAMWDVGSGQLLWTKTCRNWHGRLTWSPDGTTLAVCEPGKLLLVTPKTGETVSELATPEYLLEGSWSSDSQFLALTRDRSARVRIVNASTMAVVQEFDNSTADTDAAWSADGRWLAVSDTTSVGLYEANDVATGLLPLRQHRIERPAFGVAFSPDSTHLAIANEAGTAVVRTADWKEVWFQPGLSYDVSWSQDGAWVLSGFRRFAASDGRLLNALTGETSRITLGPVGDGSQLATISRSLLRVWDGVNGSLVSEFPQEPHDTTQLLWNFDGTRLLRVGTGNTTDTFAAEVLDPESGKNVHSLQGHNGRIWRAAWSPVNSIVATAGEDGQCLLWNASTGNLMRSLKHAEPQWWVQWSSDGKSIASASRIAISVWDTESGNLKRSFKTLSAPLPTPGWSSSADAPFSFMKDSDQLTVLGKDNGFDMFNVSTGQIVPLGNVFADGGAGTRATATWSPDFKTLASATGYREVELFQPGSKDGKSIRFFVQPYWLNDSRRVVGCDNSAGLVTAFDIKSIRRLGVLLPELPGGEYIAIGPDGNYNGSPNCAEQVVVVALHTNGSLKTYHLDEFAEAFDWKNDPDKVRLLKTGK